MLTEIGGRLSEAKVIVPEGLAGVYALCNTATGRIYVGSTIDLRGRLHQQWINLRVGGSCLNEAIRIDLRQHGIGSFTFFVLQITDDPAVLYDLEGYWIESYQAASPGVLYNSRDPKWDAPRWQARRALGVQSAALLAAPTEEHQHE